MQVSVLVGSVLQLLKNDGSNFNTFPSAHSYIAPLTAVVAFLVITFLHVVIGEQVPKCIALQYPEKISLYVAKPMDLFMTISKPFVWF